MPQGNGEILVLPNIGTAKSPPLVSWKREVLENEQQREADGLASAVLKYIEICSCPDFPFEIEFLREEENTKYLLHHQFESR